jgi:hypothetical protein
MANDSKIGIENTGFLQYAVHYLILLFDFVGRNMETGHILPDT